MIRKCLSQTNMTNFQLKLLVAVRSTISSGSFLYKFPVVDDVHISAVKGHRPSIIVACLI